MDALGGPGGTADQPLSAAEIAAIRSSGVTAVNLTVGALGSGAGVFEETFGSIGYWERELDAHPDILLKVKTAADLEKARASGRLGQAMVERMNELGLLVDLSHCGHRTTTDAIAASKKPVAITHTGCAALADLPRNKTDEELRQLAAKGGVAGIYFMPFLGTKGQPMAEDVIRHLEHALKVCGEDHVGIGTDGLLSPIELTPEYVQRHREDIANRRRAGISAPGEEEDVYTFVPDLNTPRRLETLAGLLLARGHSESRVEKVLGGNFGRLFKEVWRPA